MRTYKVYLYWVIFGKVIGKRLVYDGPSYTFALGVIIGSKHGGEVHYYFNGRRLLNPRIKARWIKGKLVW